jgi:preprotein translocase subunit SecF
MGRFATFGNDLYSGRQTIDFIARRRTWYIIAGAMTVLSVLSLLVIGLRPGIEFTGGSEFSISAVASPNESTGEDAVNDVVPGADPIVSTFGDQGIQVKTKTLTDAQSTEVQRALATAYKVDAAEVSYNFIGPSWGDEVSSKAIQGLIVFLVLVGLVISAYFRTWKMAAAGLIALVHDLVITVGLYSLTRFEVTPATVIGFLTILGYSLYDTVVVFDKVRENTANITLSTRRSYAEAANLAVNQTLVRSINTSVVALLPVASILFIGAFVLGAGTLRDISLALFVGIAAGTYSSIFVATPLLVDLRRNEPEIKAHDAKLARRRAEQAAKAADGSQDRPSTLDGPDDDDIPAGQPVTAGAGAPAGAGGNGAQRQQPRRGSRSRPGSRKR